MTMSRTFRCCVSTAALLGLLPVATAAPRCLKDTTCADYARQAERASSSKDWQTARVLFEKAYRQVPEPELLLNIGRCWHYQGQCVQAQERYREYRRLVPQPGAEPGAALQRFEQEAAACQQAPAAAPTQPGESGAAPQGAARVDVQATPAGSALAAERPARPEPLAGVLYKKWWLWTIVGTATAGAAAGLAAGLVLQQQPPSVDAPYAGLTISLTFGPRP